jgi:hypothetical protein
VNNLTIIDPSSLRLMVWGLNVIKNENKNVMKMVKPI